MLCFFKDKKGITLIELLVSLAILGIVIIPLSSCFIMAVKTNMGALDRMHANQLAQKHMERFRNGVYEKQEEWGMTIDISVEPYSSLNLIYEKDANNQKTYENICEYVQIDTLYKIRVVVKKDDKELAKLISLARMY